MSNWNTNQWEKPEWEAALMKENPVLTSYERQVAKLEAKLALGPCVCGRGCRDFSWGGALGVPKTNKCRFEAELSLKQARKEVDHIKEHGVGRPKRNNWTGD